MLNVLITSKKSSPLCFILYKLRLRWMRTDRPKEILENGAHFLKYNTLELHLVGCES